MEHDPNIFRDSSQVIQEVEDQLERILQKKFRDVDSELIERINREKEAARKRKEEIEREFDKEKTALTEYRSMVREFEEQRAGLLNEARDRFQKVLKFQSEIESLAKSTVEEIKRVNEIQERLEGLRTKTAERAAFLKSDLRERFGIVAEVMDEEPKPLDLDLDEELEKLRKIKELLTIESATANLGRLGGQAAPEEELAALDAAAVKTGPDIPGIPDLIAGPAPEEPAAAEPVPPASRAIAPARRRPDRGRARRLARILSPDRTRQRVRRDPFLPEGPDDRRRSREAPGRRRPDARGRPAAVRQARSDRVAEGPVLHQAGAHQLAGRPAGPFPPGGQDVREELLGPALLHRGDPRSPGPAAAARAAEHGELEQPRGIHRLLRRRGRGSAGPSWPGSSRGGPTSGRSSGRSKEIRPRPDGVRRGIRGACPACGSAGGSSRVP